MTHNRCQPLYPQVDSTHRARIAAVLGEARTGGFDHRVVLRSGAEPLYLFEKCLKNGIFTVSSNVM